MELTVGDLKKFIWDNKIPDSAIVLTEIVVDVYFKEHGWEKINKKTDINSITGYIEESDYCTAFCCAKHKNDNNLYINLHY